MGNAITWTSADGREVLFVGHLSSVLKPGQVKSGDLIATAGHAGWCLPNWFEHLHVNRAYDGVVTRVVLSGQTITPGAIETPNYYTSKGPVQSRWQVKTIAGQPGATGRTDGTGTTARFNYPEGIVRRADGFLYVSDTHSSTIRKVSTAGAVTTYAGQAGHDGSFDVDVTVADLNRRPNPTPARTATGHNAPHEFESADADADTQHRGNDLSRTRIGRAWDVPPMLLARRDAAK